MEAGLVPPAAAVGQGVGGGEPGVEDEDGQVAIREMKTRGLPMASPSPDLSGWSW